MEDSERLGPIASTHRIQIASINDDLPTVYHHSKNQSSSTLNPDEIN